MDIYFLFVQICIKREQDTFCLCPHKKLLLPSNSKFTYKYICMGDIPPICKLSFIDMWLVGHKKITHKFHLYISRSHHIHPKKHTNSSVFESACAYKT